jgi:hypothetical protein
MYIFLQTYITKKKTKTSTIVHVVNGLHSSGDAIQRMNNIEYFTDFYNDLQTNMQ